jgi:uncharacterized protein YkwD
MYARIILIVILYLPELSILCFSQDQDDRDYYSNHTHLNFREEKLFKETLNLKDPDIRRMEAVLFFLTNEMRVKNRLLPLAYSKKLEKTAQMHAEDMVKEGFFSHINPHNGNKKTPDDRARLHGINNPSLAENIIEGFGIQYTSNKKVYTRGIGLFSYQPMGELIKPHSYLSLGESLMKGWMNSKEHRKNILSREAVQLGCGISFYSNTGFNNMPSCKAVQNFQWYQVIQ